MQPIKFRVWDKEEKRMISWEDLLTDAEVDNGQVTDKYCLKDFENPRYEWMQYIGQTDENGKEIYQGDIIANDILDEDDEEKSLSSPSVVKWDNERICWELGEFLLPMDASECEVIGNTYENPELLKA